MAELYIGLDIGGTKCAATLGKIADGAPETETYKVQEAHLPIYHCLCAMLEEENF